MSASVISISPENVGTFAVSNILSSTIATVNQILQENHDRYHPFFNDKGFHNHITHYMLASLSLGATSPQISAAWTQEKAFQRPQPRLVEENVSKLADGEFFRSCLGNEDHYRDFLIFFQLEIKKKGYGEVLNEYVFSRTENAELTFTRLFASFLHPLIHLGYGIEFDQPAIVAEALAQTAVHHNEVGVVMLGSEAAAAAADQTDGPCRSMISLLNQVRDNDRVRHASCWGDGSWIDDMPLTAAPDELLKIAGQWHVDPSQLGEKTAEMINVNAFFCGVQD
ncbi:hypothetical protein FE257_007996 [Aspergillus nanangensis]|uniref:Uncharacterized protein n=1 Tax=Aspergillus nanangensis TaxID=2582783 RepID=A0AAD4GSZ8_ASPNN|nr:hypothetical protein FE257_007996 [Aspergillus nanangensis]